MLESKIRLNINLQVSVCFVERLGPDLRPGDECPHKYSISNICVCVSVSAMLCQHSGFRLVLDISPAWCALALPALHWVYMRGVNERTLSVC